MVYTCWTQMLKNVNKMKWNVDKRCTYVVALCTSQLPEMRHTEWLLQSNDVSNQTFDCIQLRVISSFFEHSETAPQQPNDKFRFKLNFRTLTAVRVCVFELPYIDSSFALIYFDFSNCTRQRKYVTMSNVVISDCCLSFIIESGLKYVTDCSSLLLCFGQNRMSQMYLKFTVSVHKHILRSFHHEA